MDCLGTGHWQLRQDSKPGTDDDEEKCDDRQSLAGPAKAREKRIQRYGKLLTSNRQNKARSEKQKPTRIRHARAREPRYQHSFTKVAHRGAKYQYWHCCTRGENYKELHELVEKERPASARFRFGGAVGILRRRPAWSGHFRTFVRKISHFQAKVFPAFVDRSVPVSKIHRSRAG